MYSEAGWVLLSSETQVQSQIILDQDYLPHYLSVSYKYGFAMTLPEIAMFLLEFNRKRVKNYAENPLL